MNTILTILKLVPAIIELVKAAEAAFPGSGTGPLKLDFVLAILKAVESTETGNPDLLLKVINTIVSKLYPHT